jgi:tetratricopeptide (TPR) repeat protein
MNYVYLRQVLSPYLPVLAILKRRYWRIPMGRALAIILASTFVFPVWARNSPGTQQSYQAQPSSHPTSGQSSLLSGSEIFSRARASVVVIFAASQDGKRQVLGSGFVVGRDRIATNHHVLAGMNKAHVVFSDGDIRSVSGVVADSPQQDLLILAAETGDRSPLALGDELSLQQGDSVYALGAPQGLELSLTNGIVSAFRNSDGQFLIQTTAPIAHGSSGGPLIDRAGRVVGITTSMLSDASGIYFSVGIGDLKRLLRTPQLVLLPLDEWAKQNPDRPVDVSGTETTNIPKEIEALLAKKKFDEARTAIQLLAEKSPDAAVVHRLEGELLSRTGHLDSALGEFTISVKQDPNDTLAHFYYAIALFEAHRFQEALSEEQTSYRLSPGPGDQPLLALLYYANHDYRQAEPMARAALNTDQNNETAINVLTGIAYHGDSSYVRIQDSQGKMWDLPQSNLEAARRADPNLQLVNSAQTLSDWVQQAARVNADNFWVHITNANDAIKQKQPDRAVAEYAAAENDDFPDATAYLGLTYLYLRSSQIGQASDQIKLGLSAVPEDAQLLNEGMFVALLARNNTEAKRRFDDIEQFYPNSGSALSSGCLYYYGTLQSPNALSYCERLTNEFPSDHTSHSNYGWAALDANQFQLALREFSKSYQLVSSNWNQLTEVQVVDLMWGFTLADYYSGDKKQARKLLEVIRKQYLSAATVTGLQQMPLLWSSTTMSRIETILREFPK